MAPQVDEWCLGLRCFAVIRQFFERVVSSTCAGRRFNPEAFWAPMSGWVFPDQVRDDMTAAAAFQARKYAHGLPRLALAYVKGPAPSGDALEDLLSDGGYMIHHCPGAPGAVVAGAASSRSTQGAKRKMRNNQSPKEEAAEPPSAEPQAKKVKASRVPLPARRPGN